MPEKPNVLRDQLLAQSEPSRDKLTRYQQETEAMLKELDKRLRWEKWGVAAIWLYAVAFMTICLFIVGYRVEAGKTPPETVVLSMGFFLVIYGAIELIKHFINLSRVEILKELKSLETQVLELRERLPKS